MFGNWNCPPTSTQLRRNSGIVFFRGSNLQTSPSRAEWTGFQLCWIKTRRSPVGTFPLTCFAIVSERTTMLVTGWWWWRWRWTSEHCGLNSLWIVLKCFSLHFAFDICKMLILINLFQFYNRSTNKSAHVTLRVRSNSCTSCNAWQNRRVVKRHKRTERINLFRYCPRQLDSKMERERSTCHSLIIITTLFSPYTVTDSCDGEETTRLRSARVGDAKWNFWRWQGALWDKEGLFETFKNRKQLFRREWAVDLRKLTVPVKSVWISRLLR